MRATLIRWCPASTGTRSTWVKAIYTAVDATAACSAFDELTEQWSSEPGNDPIVGPDRGRLGTTDHAVALALIAFAITLGRPIPGS
jgi:hypothetical protein